MFFFHHGAQKLLAIEMRSATELRKEKENSQVVVAEAQKYKASFDKYIKRHLARSRMTTRIKRKS